ncbi:MAG: YjzC family protein [Bacteroidetes bacterium]|nr:YjzC family protein [Bacteroidota bacterium]
MSSLQKPGEIPAKPGEYIERGPRGGKVPAAREVTIDPEDKPLPPTQEPGRKWERIGPPKS